MPIVGIPIKSRAKLLENARALRVAKAAKEEWKIDNLESWASGFLDAMRCEYLSEVVGMLIMDYDEVLEDGVSDDDTFTARLPKLVAKQ